MTLHGSLHLLFFTFGHLFWGCFGRVFGRGCCFVSIVGHIKEVKLPTVFFYLYLIPDLLTKAVILPCRKLETCLLFLHTFY